MANPPYIPLDAWESVDPEVRDHDPALALWAEDDGLAVIRQVERTAARLLRPGGVVAVEHAEAQADSAPAIFSTTGAWHEVRDHLDLAGRSRFVTATRVADPGPVPAARRPGAATVTGVSERFDVRRARRSGQPESRSRWPALARGELVVVPTDTVYGVACDAFTPTCGVGAAGREGARTRHAGAGDGRLARHVPRDHRDPG